MERGYLLFVLSIVIFPLTASFAFASSLGFVGFDTISQLDNDITVRMNSSTSDYTLFYARPHDLEWKSTAGSGNTFIIPQSEVQSQGLYHMYIEQTGNPSERFPSDGFLYALVGSRNEELYETMLLYGENDPVFSSACNPITANNYNCPNEVEHAHEIKRMALLYSVTGNSSYLTAYEGLINHNWVGTFCDNFNCQNGGFDYNLGSHKQGYIISLLSDAYKYSDNTQVKEYLLNFSSTNNAACNVWDNDFNCTSGTNSVRNSAGQGRMLQGYAKVYTHTNNDDLRDIMHSLASFVMDHADSFVATSDLVAGLSEYYFVTGNESVRQLAEQHTLDIIDSCVTSSVDSIAFSNCIELAKYIPYIISHNNVHRIDSYSNNISLSKNSLVHSLLFNMSLRASGLCSISDGFRCSTNGIQSSLVSGFHYLAHSLQNSSIGFYGPRFITLNETEYLLHINLARPLQNVDVYYRDPLSSTFMSAPVSELGGVSIPNTFGLQSHTLEYYFEADGLRYPPLEDTYLHKSIPLSTNDIPNIYDRSLSFAFTSPLQSCNPFSIDPSYACQYDFMQGKYITSLSQMSHYNESLLHAVGKLSSTKIDETDIFSTCDPFDNNFICTLGFIGNQIRRPGLIRAMNLAEGYTIASTVLNNHTLLNYAQKFLYLSNDQPYASCNIWENDFICATSKKQTQYIKSLLDLYDQTGDEVLYRKLEMLSQELLSFDDGFDTIDGLITIYPHFGNDTIKDRILDFVRLDPTYCHENFNCTVEEFYRSISLTWRAYGLFEENDLFESGNLLIQRRPISFRNHCDAQNPTPAIGYSCDTPLEQALAINAYYDVLENYILREPPNFNISIDLNITNITDTSPQLFEARLDELINVTCSVTNTGNFSASTYVILNTPFTTISDSIVQINSLPEGDTRNVSFIIQASQANRNEVSCTATNFDASALVDVYFTGPILDMGANVPLVASELNNHTLGFSLINTFDYDIFNATLTIPELGPLGEIGQLVNVTSPNYEYPQFFTWNQSLGTITVPNLFGGETFNFTLWVEPYGGYDGLINFDMISNYNGSNSFNFNVLVDFDGFNFTRIVNGTPVSNESEQLNLYLYQLNQLNLSIVNTKDFNVSNVNVSLLYNTSAVEIESVSYEYNGSFVTLPAGITNFVIPLFVQDSEINVSVTYFLSNGSLYTNPQIQFQLESIGILERSTYPLNPLRDIISITMNSPEDYFNETAPLFITLFDALFTNQNLVSVILNYDASSFEIDFDEIISPFTSVLASRNTVVDTVDVIGDVASWITNISQLDGNTGVLIADPINPFYGVFNATEMFSSTNESEDIALQNVSYQLFFTNTVPINYSLRGNLSLYNESSLISYSECDITVSPHLCVLELNETIRNISQFTSSFTLSLMHDNDSVQTSYTTSVPLSTFVSVPTKDSSSALVNLSSSQLGHVSLYANTSLPESFMNVNATHDIILDGSLSVNYTVIPAVQTLSPYFSQHYNVSGHLSVYNESTSTLLADTSCTANTSPFECSVDVIPSGAENVTSSLTISLDRLTPFAINSSIDLDELTSSIDIDAASGLANISELDGNNVTLYTNETVHESSVLVSGTASPELTYPFANFSISVHTIDETPIPENHTLFVTTSIVNATNNAQTFQSESCDFTETSLSPFSCSIVVPWNDSYSRVLTSVNFTRTDGFDEPMQSLAIDFVNKTLIEFDNSTTLFNINHIFVNQTESVSPVSLHLDFVDVQYEYANRSFTGEVTFADENEIHLSLSSINIGENKTFTLPGRVLTDGNLFANVSSIEGGLAEAEGVVTLLIPPTPPSNETTTPGTGGGGGGGAASQPEIEEEEDVDRTMYLISESYTTSLSVNLFNQHLSALKGLNLVSTELYVYDDVKNTSNGRVHQQEGEERDELVRLAESTNFAASAEYYSTLSHVYGCLNYYRRDVREDAGELYITLFGRNFCPDEISFSIFDNSSSFNQFQPTLQNTRTENIQNISYGEGYITGDVHLDAYEDFSLTYVLPLTNTLRNNINSNILLWQINEAFVPYLSYEEFQIELHSEPDNITTIPPVLIPEQESTFAQVTAFIGELTQLNFFEIVIVASLIVVFIIVIIASTFISFREHSSHVSNVIHMALRPRASLKNHEVVTSIGIQSAYLSKLIKEDDLDRAQNEYEKIRVNYVEARKKLNDADPQVHKIMFQVITQLNDYRKHILQRKAELKSAHITSQTQRQSHKQEEDTNPHHEYDMLLRIKAAHIEMTHKNFKAAEEILITSKKLLEKLSDEDLDGQKENFDSRLKLLETTLIKLRSGSLKYRLSQLFKFSKNNASVEKQASNQPTPS